MSKPVEAVRAALGEDVMQLRLHVGGSFAGELPHVYVSFAFGSTKDCSMEPVRDDGVCNPAHVQALRVRIADPSRMWAAGPSIGTAPEVAEGRVLGTARLLRSGTRTRTLIKSEDEEDLKM